MNRLLWFLTKWIAPVGPVFARAKSIEAHDGHRYDFYGFGIAIRRRKKV